MLFLRFRMKVFLNELKENFYSWLSYRLPKKLVYYATIRLGVDGTTGKYSNTNVASVRFMTILKRWGNK